MAKKKEPEPKAGAPEWMTTFGDMMTLLLTFFVLLFSFSTIDATKWRELVSAFSGAPAVFSGDPMSIPNPGEKPMGAPVEFEGEVVEEADEWEEVVRKAMEYVQQHELGGDVTVEANDYEIIVRVRGDIVFDSGKADLKEDAKGIIIDFFKARVINELHNFSTIRIEGHTDNVPISNWAFHDNVQLSQRRSWAVWNFIVNTYPPTDPQFPHIDPGMIDCNGRGEYHPISDNTTPEGRARNRRVDFVLVRKLSQDLASVTNGPRQTTQPQPGD